MHTAVRMELTHHGHENQDEAAITSLTNPSSRALAGRYPELSQPGSGDEREEASLDAPAELQEHDREPHNTNMVASSPASPDDMDYLDLASFTSPPPSSDTDENPSLSLSHPGTRGKRDRAPSPEQLNCENEVVEREMSPDFNGCMSTLERNCRVNHWDARVPDGPPDFPMLVAPTADPPHRLDPESASVISNALGFEGPQPEFSSARALASPRGPRPRPLVCFFWYHRGECTPKFMYGRRTICMFEHSLEGPDPQVSLPPALSGHNPECSLPLCPVRLANPNPKTANRDGRGFEKTAPKEEPSTPTRHGAVDTPYSSSPRDAITQARYFVKGPKFSGRSNSHQLPKLTGARRERFKSQWRAIEKWQRDNGGQLFGAARQPMDKTEAKGQNKQQNPGKRPKTQTRGDPVLNYGDVLAKDADAHPTASSATQRSKLWRKNKKNKVRRRKKDLSQRDAMGADETVNLDTKVEVHEKSSQPGANCTKHAPARDTTAEMEDRQQDAMIATGTVHSEEHILEPSSSSVSRLAPSVIDEADRLGTESTTPDETGLTGHANTEPKVLVDYELPMDESRLDWDTDVVRRAFGEIE
jgi:hypothetical protein